MLIDDVYASGKADPVTKYPLLSEAVKEGFLHPNCRRPITTHFEGISSIPESSDYDQTRKNYEAEQRQRYLERRIRRAKRKQLVAQTPEAKAEADAELEYWQSRMREHLKQNFDFRRKPEREKVYDGETSLTRAENGAKIREKGAEHLLRDDRGLFQASPIYVSRSDGLFENSQRIKPIDGFEDSVCHGDRESFAFIDQNGNVTNVSAREFAGIILETPTYKGGNIRLISCEVGAGENSIARDLAAELHVTVLAPTEIVHVNRDGNMFVTNNLTLAEMWNEGIDVIETGRWVEIDPHGGVKPWETISK